MSKTKKKNRNLNGFQMKQRKEQMKNNSTINEIENLMNLHSNGHIKVMSNDDLQNMDEFSSPKYRKRITNELNNTIELMKKVISNPYNYKGRNVVFSFLKSNGEPYRKDEPTPNNIGDLGVYTYQTISQSRVLGNDEGTHGSTGSTHYEGYEPVWNIGNMGSVWIDVSHYGNPYRVHYISKLNQDKNRPVQLIVENMDGFNPFGGIGIN